ncbi:hypothetical protein GGR92_005445 [Spirosoma lacussanchae]|uniref:hypothetical protein n=1 Tax=Spirosoma lacussanchae TaxID=1884249 RepID=UPI00110952AE|nr:hypothetical protein [Spirosoma lacussanchae]
MILVRESEQAEGAAVSASLPRTNPRSLLQVVSRYREILTSVTQRAAQEDAPTVASFLGLSLTNYYTKRRGERPFNYADVCRLVERYGDEQDRADLQTFLNVRDGLYSQLQNSPIPLVRFRRLLGLQHYRDLARRREHPDTWRLADLEKIGQFLAQVGQV